MPGTNDALNQPVQLQARLRPFSQRVIDKNSDYLIKGKLIRSS